MAFKIAGSRAARQPHVIYQYQLEVGMFYGAKGVEERYIAFLSPRWMEMLAPPLARTRRARRSGWA
jgi:hypothetical protein